MWWRNRLAVMWKATPRSSQGTHSAFGDGAPVSPGFLPDLGEGPEGMLPKKQGRALVEEVHVHLPDQGPAPGPVEGREGRSREPTWYR